MAAGDCLMVSTELSTLLSLRLAGRRSRFRPHSSRSLLLPLAKFFMATCFSGSDVLTTADSNQAA